MRNGAALCFAAGISWVVSASVAPPYREAEDLPERIADIAEASVWVTYHFGVFVTGAILMVALVWVTRSITGRVGRTLALAGNAASMLGVGLSIVIVWMNMTVLKPAADRWADALEHEKPIELMAAQAAGTDVRETFFIWAILLGATFALFGLAQLLAARRTNLGWVAIVAGVAGTLVALRVPDGFLILEFAISSLAMVGWLVAVGARLHGGPSEPASGSE